MSALTHRLARNWERMRSEPGLKKNVIVITALVLLALGTGSWILGNQRFTPPWADRFEFAAEFAATPGIAPGNGQEVRMHGVIVGQITKARVNDRGLAEVVMSLEPEYEVYENATLVLRPKSPLNEMYIEVDPGGPPSKQVRSGTTLPVTNTERPIQVDEVLSHLDDQARAAVTSLLAEADVALTRADRHLPAGLDAASEVVGDLGPVMGELDTRRDELARLVTALSDISRVVGDDDKRLTSLAAALSSTLGSVAGESAALDASLAELPRLTTRLQSSTRSVSQLTKQLDPTLRGVQDATEELPGALERLDSTVEKARTTVTIARPTVRNARPLVADLRPTVDHLHEALPIAARSTARLDPVTAKLVEYLPDLAAFVVHTRSVMSLRDANGGILRGMALVNDKTISPGGDPVLPPRDTP